MTATPRLLTLFAVLTPAAWATTQLGASPVGDQDLGGLRRVVQEKGQDGESSSSTRRIVVVNGETVVDETTKDGKPVTTKRIADHRRRKPGRDATMDDLERLLKDLEGFGGRSSQLPGDLEELLKDARADAEAVADAMSDRQSSSSKSSHTRRVVVINGKTVVDEETRDGKPVRGKGRKAPDIDDLLDGLDLDDLLDGQGVPPDLLKKLKNGESSSSSSSSSRRIVVINGETVVDEEIKDGKPVKGGKRDSGKPRKPTRDLDELLEGLGIEDLEKGLPDDIPADLKKRLMEELEDELERARKSGAKPKDGEGFRRVPAKRRKI